MNDQTTDVANGTSANRTTEASAGPREVVFSEGLEDVVAARTRLSEVDGAAGRLTIAGLEVAELVARLDFPALARRLLRIASGDEPDAVDAGSAPSAEERDLEFERALARARVEAFEELVRDEPLGRFDAPMEALRAALASMPASEEVERDAIRVIGAIPVVNAAWQRKRDGAAPIPPDGEAGHAADYLRMLRDAEAEDGATEGLDRYWTAVSDHGLNASTFAARVVASTGSDLVSAVVAAIGALKGPLHGGAPGPVSEMLDAIETPERAEAWLRGELDAGRRIMGMGHRVYDVRDPRAKVFEDAIERIDAERTTSDRLALARRVETSAERILAERYPSRDLRANVEFYTAVLLETVGIPRALFSATFAAGRAAGWVAHVVEQSRTGRLIRPRGEYVGPRLD